MAAYVSEKDKAAVQEGINMVARSLIELMQIQRKLR